MEKEAAKPLIALPLQPVEFLAGSYSVRVALESGKLFIKAYSELNGKMFEATIEENNLSESDRAVLGDCEGAFGTIEECLLENRKVLLSDVGELHFPYFSGPARRRQERTL